MLAVFLLSAPAPRDPLLRRCVIAAIIALTAPCASLVPTSELPARGYIAGLTGRRPSLFCIPDLATVPPPLRRRAPWGPSPDSSTPPKDPAFAAIRSARRSQLPQLPSRGVGNDAAAIPSCCGPVACSPSWAVPSCDGEGFILGAFIGVVTHLRRPICYAAVRLLPRPVLPRLA